MAYLYTAIYAPAGTQDFIWVTMPFIWVVKPKFGNLTQTLFYALAAIHPDGRFKYKVHNLAGRCFRNK